MDEWNCVWQRSSVANTGQVIGYPLADWPALRGFRWPDPDNHYADGEAIGVALDTKQILPDAFLEADPWRRM